MSAERWRRIQELYHAAQTRPANERAAFLDEACAGDGALRQEIESLLAQPVSTDDFLDRPALEVVQPIGAMRLAAGTRLGSYEIAGLLGAGGMGEVYRARDTTLGRDVAIKILPSAFTADADRLARFEREARLLASLNHPSIGGIYGVEDADGVRALVLELVDGPTLAERIAQGPMPIEDALPIARQIADALEAAHEKGIVHRDLKPANIKITPDGIVKVLDFGLAKALAPETASATAQDLSHSPTIVVGDTRQGMILGTAAYMSPEQARGKPVDKRSDIWAFGCVLYEMLTGRRAFEDEDVSMTLSKVLQREPGFEAFPTNVPPRVRHTVRMCLRKSSKERIADIHDVRLALEGAFETAAAHATQDAVVAQPVWRRALPVAAALMAGGVVVSLLAGRLWLAVQPQPVQRFSYAVPPGQILQSVGRPVIAFSRDGSHFLYNTDDGLYLRSMGDLEARLIPGTDTSSANPFLSPDGEAVGYWEAGQLKRLSLSGGAAVVICAATNPFGVSWERDNTILFGQAKGIMRVSANGGTPELVIPAKEGEQVDGPQLLPDGDSVLFSVTTASGATRWDTAQIVVQSLSTGNRKTLLQGGSAARYVSTGHLVYALRNALFAVAFDVDQLEISGGPVSIIEGVARAGNPMANTATANYAISDRGTLVYLEPVEGGFILGAAAPLRNLVWVDRKGQEEALSTPPRGYVYPRLSPDGTRVALDIREQEQDIWIWGLRRQTMTRLTFDPLLDGLPVWTPNGQRLVWASSRAGTVLNLYSQAADGTGTVERLTESPNDQRGSSLTPDGTRLIFTQVVEGQGGNVGMLSLEGDRPVSWLVNTTFDERNGDVSADGRWLAYESNESGQFQIYVRPFPDVDQGRWQVSTNGGRQPVWARSKRELIYVAPDGTLMGVPLNIGQARSFTAGTPAKLVAGDGYYYAWSDQNQGRTYDVSPDGQRFLRLKEGGPSDTESASITVVQNWFEELKRLVPTN